VALMGYASFGDNPRAQEMIEWARIRFDGTRGPTVIASKIPQVYIFGSRRTPVEQGVSRATGINAQQVAQLLMMLAPLVMGVLGRMKRQQGVGAEQLPEVLGQANLDMARQSPAVGDLSRILDSNHDGQIADEIARIGSSVLGGLVGQAAGR
jgi:hypothetical protein